MNAVALVFALIALWLFGCGCGMLYVLLVTRKEGLEPASAPRKPAKHRRPFKAVGY